MKRKIKNKLLIVLTALFMIFCTAFAISCGEDEYGGGFTISKSSVSVMVNGDTEKVRVLQDGEVYTGMIFSIGLNGNWYVQFEGMVMPQDLGTTVLAGELQVMFGIITLTFPSL